MGNKKRETVILRKGNQEVQLDYSAMTEALTVLREIRPQIFISYSKEKGNRFAKLIRNSILNLTGNNEFVFVASESIPIGEDWFDALRKALDRSQVFIIILDQDYVNNPFTNFEFGGAFLARNMKIIVLKIQQQFIFSHTPFSQLQFPMYITNDKNAEYIVKSICGLFILEAGDRDIQEKVAQFKEEVLHFLNHECLNEGDFHDSRAIFDIE